MGDARASKPGQLARSCGEQSLRGWATSMGRGRKVGDMGIAQTSFAPGGVPNHSRSASLDGAKRLSCASSYGEMAHPRASITTTRQPWPTGPGLRAS